jgi:hypothetical protein
MCEQKIFATNFAIALFSFYPEIEVDANHSIATLKIKKYATIENQCKWCISLFQSS